MFSLFFFKLFGIFSCVNFFLIILGLDVLFFIFKGEFLELMVEDVVVIVEVIE